MAAQDPNDMPIAQEPISRALHNLTDLGIVTTDVELRVTGWNRWMEVHTGHAASDVLGSKLIDIYPELVQRRHDQHYHQALQGRVVVLAQRFHRYLIPMPGNVGGALPYMQQSARIAPLIDDQMTVGTLTIIEDVSERVNYDSQLAKHASRQQAISSLSQLALGGATVDEVLDVACRLTASTLDAPIVAVFEQSDNAIALTLTCGIGWETSDKGRHIADATDVWHLAEALQRKNEPVTASEEELCLTPIAVLRVQGVKNGICIALSGPAGPITVLAAYTTIPRDFSDDERRFLKTISGIVGMAMDRHQLLRQLESKVNDLAIADQRKDEFLAMLGHELRNPLAPITNATELLRQNLTDEVTRNWATDVISRQLLQITRLVDDLLDVARITRGKISLRKSIVDVRTIMERALETSRPLLESRRHQLMTVLPPKPLLIECDAERLAQVVANLLNNAAKYTQDGGTIQLAVEEQGSIVAIAIRDTGVGIAAEMLPSIFDLFTQVNPSLDRKEGGLGIGLTLVKSLVALHGGTVEVHSEGTGRGSEFIVRLPLPDLRAKKEFTSPLLASPPSRLQYRVLVVDDNQDAADLLKLLLETFGHVVSCAYDGPAALQEVAQQKPDIVVLDIGLPGMTGYEVAQILHQTYGDTIVLVALTGYGQEEDRRRTKNAGFDYHLVKPIAASEIDGLFGRMLPIDRGQNETSTPH
jgi:PAS domain S-box-containing protein